MRTARLLAAISAPIFVVACAVGAAPDGGGTEGDGDGGVTAAGDSGYGTTGDGSPAGADSGSSDSGTTSHDSGTTPIDSGSPGGGSGLDCSGSTSSSGEKYSDECLDLITNDDCSQGGGECGSGLCCQSNFGCEFAWLSSGECVPL
jgi:hypothetical protein